MMPRFIIHKLTSHIPERNTSKAADFSYKAYVLTVNITVYDSVLIFSNETGPTLSDERPYNCEY
jgi:hypothetical protein